MYALASSTAARPPLIAFVPRTLHTNLTYLYGETNMPNTPANNTLDMHQALHVHLDLRNTQLAGKDLRGHHFLHCNLTGVDLRGCDLSGAGFASCSMGRVDLRNVDARGCCFHSTDLRCAHLDGCALDGADLRGVDLRDVSFLNATFNGANLENVTWVDEEGGTWVDGTYQ